MEVTVFSFEAVNVLYNKLEYSGRENIYSKQISISFEVKTENNKIESGLLYSLIYENDIIFPPDFLTTHKA